jgi:hypothetical protein
MKNFNLFLAFLVCSTVAMASVSTEKVADATSQAGDKALDATAKAADAANDVAKGADKAAVAAKLTEVEFKAQKALAATKCELSAKVAAEDKAAFTAAAKAEAAVDPKDTVGSAAAKLVTAAAKEKSEASAKVAAEDKAAFDKLVSDNTTMLSKVVAGLCVVPFAFDSLFTTPNLFVKNNVIQPTKNFTNACYSNVVSALEDHSVTLVAGTVVVAGIYYAYSEYNAAADKKSKI